MSLCSLRNKNTPPPSRYLQSSTNNKSSSFDKFNYLKYTEDEIKNQLKFHNKAHIKDPKNPNNREYDYLKYTAEKIAPKSNIRSHKHGAIIVENNNKIISYGYNHHFTFDNNKGFSIHAEIDALNKILKMKRKVNNLDLYVVRIGTDNLGNPLKYSKPCLNCTKRLLECGLINKIYYSAYCDDNLTYKLK
jgi:deoxycytidylate deaminase